MKGVKWLFMNSPNNFISALELIDMKYIEGCNAIITLNKSKKYERKIRC